MIACLGCFSLNAKGGSLGSQLTTLSTEPPNRQVSRTYIRTAYAIPAAMRWLIVALICERSKNG